MDWIPHDEFTGRCLERLEEQVHLFPRHFVLKPRLGDYTQCQMKHFFPNIYSLTTFRTRIQDLLPPSLKPFQTNSIHPFDVIRRERWSDTLPCMFPFDAIRAETDNVRCARNEVKFFVARGFDGKWIGQYGTRYPYVSYSNHSRVSFPWRGHAKAPDPRFTWGKSCYRFIKELGGAAAGHSSSGFNVACLSSLVFGTGEIGWVVFLIIQAFGPSFH
mmetsp:Transcript_36995/g.78131  ORF Transcript_36995/g.78131 Transcript_36995/m.78131 type:complete len:216 (-) Transcript_36995:543-1190(-)